MKYLVVRLHGSAQRLGTMRQETVSAPELESGRSRGAPKAPYRTRFLVIAVLLSVAVHLAAALLVVFLPHVMPHEARPQEQGTIELLMVEKKGADPSQAGQPTEPKPTAAPPEKTVEATKEAAPKPEPDVPASKPAPALPVDAKAAALPPPAPEQAPAEPAKADPAAEAQVVPPRPQQAPVFNLAGTESESNAFALGPHILPAMPDNRFRNRPPIYPAEAEMRGLHGSVVVVIHVSENGTATGVDVAESSGVEMLDDAAVTAVRKWRFHPAMKEGRTVPFEMPFRFIFEAN
jgi:protein TonB